MSGDQLRAVADVEVYPDEPTAIRALQDETRVLRTDSATRPPLPEFAGAAGAVDVGGVTRIRPDDVAIRDEQLRPGLLYARLVSEYRRDRLIMNFADLRPFGHPFHDDVFVILRALGRVGGRLAVCRVEEWYLERLQMYPFIRITGPGKTHSERRLRGV